MPRRRVVVGSSGRVFCRRRGVPVARLSPAARTPMRYTAAARQQCPARVYVDAAAAVAGGSGGERAVTGRSTAVVVVTSNRLTGVVTARLLCVPPRDFIAVSNDSIWLPQSIRFSRPVFVREGRTDFSFRFTIRDARRQYDIGPAQTFAQIPFDIRSATVAGAVFGAWSSLQNDRIVFVVHTFERELNALEIYMVSRRRNTAGLRGRMYFECQRVHSVFLCRMLKCFAQRAHIKPQP